jgi:hypothetical protein
MALRVLFAAFFAAASMQSAAKPEAAGAPAISAPAQPAAAVVRCRVTRTDDTAVYGRNNVEIYSLADMDFRIWDDDARKWASIDNAAHWSGKYYSANARENVSRGRSLIKKWIFNRGAGSMIYKLETTLGRNDEGVIAQDVIETRIFDFRCERTLDPSQLNGSNAF